MADECDADRLACFGDRELYDTHLHLQHPPVRQEKRFANVVRHTFDQRKMGPRWERPRRSVLQV